MGMIFPFRWTHRTRVLSSPFWGWGSRKFWSSTLSGVQASPEDLPGLQIIIDNVLSLGMVREVMEKNREINKFSSLIQSKWLLLMDL